MSNELSHGLFNKKKGYEVKDHKYILRIGKPGVYQYFYTLDEVKAYYTDLGKNKINSIVAKVKGKTEKNDSAIQNDIKENKLSKKVTSIPISSVETGNQLINETIKREQIAGSLADFYDPSSLKEKIKSTASKVKNLVVDLFDSAANYAYEHNLFSFSKRLNYKLSNYVNGHKTTERMTDIEEKHKNASTKDPIDSKIDECIMLQDGIIVSPVHALKYVVETNDFNEMQWDDDFDAQRATRKAIAREQVNPDYGFKYGTTNNCALCTAVLELNRRGLEGISAGRVRTGVDMNSMASWFTNSDKQIYVADNSNEIDSIMQSFGDKSSGAITMHNLLYGGHAIHFTIQNGIVQLEDGQCSEYVRGKSFSEAFEKYRKRIMRTNADFDFGLIRWDNCDINYEAMYNDDVLRGNCLTTGERDSKGNVIVSNNYYNLEQKVLKTLMKV